MVCSSFVVELWKNGGLFGNLTVQGTEWTPKDIYQSVILDPNPPMPEVCQAANPNGKLCQIMGDWTMVFPGFSTIQLYSNMDEHCQGEPPLYQRIPEGC